MTPFSSFISEFTSRKLAVLIDDLGTTVRGVLFAPAAEVSPEIVNSALSIARGQIFVAVTPPRADLFALRKMSRPAWDEKKVNVAPDVWDICTSVEAREGVTTGISSADRSVTIKVLGDIQPLARKLIQPGHIVPVVVSQGGTLVRPALPEAVVDCVIRSEFSDAAMFIEMLDEQGSFPDEHYLLSRASTYELPVIRLSQLLHHRLATELLVSRVAEAKLPTQLAGELKSIMYKVTHYEGEHLALVKGDIDPALPVLTRVQTENTFSDVFGGTSHPTREQLHSALRKIGAHGSGVLLYLRRPAEGQLCEQVSSLGNNVPAKSKVTMREYGIGAQILRDLGIKKIDLLTSSPKSIVGLDQFGIEITKTTSLN